MNIVAVDTYRGDGYALPMDARNEAILVDQARAGCEQSFEVLVKQNSEKMIQLAMRMVNNRSDAEEISQEAFIRLYRSLDSFRGESKISTWLYRTVTRLCIDYLRREKLKRKLFFFQKKDADYDLIENSASKETAQDDLYIAREELGHMFQALDKLSPRQRAVLTLRHQENLSLKEIASVLELSQGSVKVHLHRAVQTLRTALEDLEEKDGQ